MKSISLLALAIVALAVSSTAKTYNRCSLARALFALGVPKHELPVWTCIAKHESAFRTHVIGPANTDGSHDYGIFQINDRFWCHPSNGRASSNNCRISCSQLLKDDLRNSVKCVRKVKAEKRGWALWSTWRKCSGALPSINNCF